MIRIDSSLWWDHRFARVTALADVLRFPQRDYEALPTPEKDKLRQTQIEPGEVVQLLGEHEDHRLIRKFDQVIGWLPISRLQLAEEIGELPIPCPARSTPGSFLAAWEGTPYLWGGITRAGIDCSGLTQRYFHEVHCRVIPKNSRDQRRRGRAKPMDQVQDHDLIFCQRTNGAGVHHVAIRYDGDVWHARTEGGVVRQSMSAFLSLYEVLEVVSLLD